jgi:TetR/AcrR family transcriptional regulator, transcriptional repressor for nem operon
MPRRGRAGKAIRWPSCTGMLEIMASFTERQDEYCTCMVGMMSQELGQTHPAIREACDIELERWTRNTARLLEEAKLVHPVAKDFDPNGIAWFLTVSGKGPCSSARCVETKR